MLGLTDQTINELLMKPMYHMAEFMLDYVENIISCNEVCTDLRIMNLRFLSFISTFKLSPY